jgi:PAS domain S-box-containing protein
VDQILQAAQDDADRQGGPRSMATEADSVRARALLEDQRSSSDVALGHERAERRRSRTNVLLAERRATDKDLTGERINTDTLIVDLREANEQMVAATIRAQELTERAESAQAQAETTTNELRASEERYRTLFDLCPVAVYSCDTTGLILKFNRHAADLWGREPAIGDTDERFCGSFKMFRPDGSFMPHELCPMADALSGKISDVRDAEVIIERPDGSRVTVVVNIRPLKNSHGEVTSAINCFYDITDRKQAENQMGASLSRELELSEFRETFIGILGHDLRTPLSSIVMASAMLLERGHLDEQDAKTVARIIRSDQRMTEMITQLLDLTRARLGGGLPIERQPTDLREVIRHVAEEFDAPIQQEVDGDVTGLWDQGRLSEVLSNLAGNAIEYATRGTPVVVKAHAEGGDVVVEVSNHGDPIPADVLPFIFEPFRRARPHEKSATKNLGLGLYIAHQIVLSHGGTLDGQSADGTTTFVMRLPRRPLAL